MKRTRLLALLLAVCLCAALVVPASAAETDFTDIPSPLWDWARPSIRAMTQQKIFTGYGDGTFRPGVSMQRVEGFALCARVTQKADTRLQIAADQAARLKELFPDEPENWWFAKEAATCDALGIETLETLADMNESGALIQPMTKAEFAKYLVRGMGLEDLARTLDADDLPFRDEASIAGGYRPYVKLLYTYGVLTGDENNNFNPDQPMSRAVCATMMARSLEHIVEERGVSLELPQYTKYIWDSGTIVDVEVEDGVRRLKLNSAITGEKTVTLAANTRIFQYNKADTFTALRTGAFAKVCYNPDGTVVEAVRVTPASLIEKVSGACDSLTTDAILIDGDRYTIDRFTQVSAGGKTGDRAIIDYDANYTDAEAAVNSQGAVLWLKLSGGTRLVEGILTGLTTETMGAIERTTITVNAYNGVATTYTVPASAKITINGDEASLKESQKGRQVILRVADADLGDVKAVEVNMTDRFIQGVLRAVDAKEKPYRVDLRADGETKSTRYELSDDCAVTYGGVKTDPTRLNLNSFVTARIEGGTVTALMAWQGYDSTEGTLTNLAYGADGATLTVTRDNGTTAPFFIPVDRLGSVSFLTKGEDSNITKLKTGDHVVVTLLYNEVTQVDFTPQAANVSGALAGVAFPDDGSVQLTVRFTDGSTHVYTASAGTTVMQGGKPVSIDTLASRRNSQISLVAEGDRAVSIEITGSVSSTTELEGTIWNKDDKARIATILVMKDGKSETFLVHIPTGVTILDVVSNTTLLNISRLNIGDTITAYGSYVASEAYDFEATSVIRK